MGQHVGEYETFQSFMLIGKPSLSFLLLDILCIIVIDFPITIQAVLFDGTYVLLFAFLFITFTGSVTTNTYSGVYTDIPLGYNKNFVYHLLYHISFMSLAVFY